MSSTLVAPPDLLGPAVYLAALAVSILSGLLIYRQSLIAYRIIRRFFLGVYVSIFILITLELLRVTIGSPQFMTLYAPVSVGLSLTQATLLSASSIAMYIGPIDSSNRTFVRSLRSRPVHAVLLALFVLSSVTAGLGMAIFRPYTIGLVTSFSGARVYAIEFPVGYTLLLVLLLVFFLSYPTVVLFRTIRSIPNPELRGSLLSLPVGWVGVTTLYVVFDGLIWIYGLDATAIMYLMNAVLFFFVTRNFRKAAVLAGLFMPSLKAVEILPTRGPATQGGWKARDFGGKPILLVADATIGFESAAKSLATDFLSDGRTVFFFTPRGSPVNRALSDRDDIKLYEMTASVSSYQAGARHNELLISSNNTSILLDALSKTIGTNAEQGSAVVFDSISDLVVSLGFETTYRFVRASIEMASGKNVALVFLMLSGVHELKVENVMRSLFSIELAQGEYHVRVVKAPSVGVL